MRALVAGLTLTLAGASSLAAQALPTPAAAPPMAAAGSYTFRMVDDDGDVQTGTVEWSGSKVRIDLSDGGARRTRGTRRQGEGAELRMGDENYLLIDNASGTLYNVKTQEREVAAMPVATFEGIIGKALGAVQVMVQMRVQNAGILARDLGSGGMVAGQPTHQFRLIEEFDVNIGVMGMSAEKKHHRVVTEFWVPTATSMPRNPMAELVLRAPAALAQQDRTHSQNVLRTRAALFRSAPVKMITTVRADGEGEKRAEFEVTGLRTTAPAAARFELPANYRRRKTNFTTFEL